MKKTVLVYGLIAGIICGGTLGVSMLLNDGSLNFENGMYFGFASIILAAVVIWFGISQYKKNRGGTISFGKAFTAGLLMSLIASTMYVLTWMIAGPADFGKVYANYEIEMMRKKGVKEEQIAQHVEKTKADWEMYDNNAAYRAGLTYMEILPVQLIIVLIASIIISRKKKEKPEFSFEN